MSSAAGTFGQKCRAAHGNSYSGVTSPGVRPTAQALNSWTPVDGLVERRQADARHPLVHLQPCSPTRSIARLAARVRAQPEATHSLHPPERLFRHQTPLRLPTRGPGA